MRKLAVMEGFEIDLRDKILAQTLTSLHQITMAALMVLMNPLAKLDQFSNIEAAAPFVYLEMMIKSSQSASGVDEGD